MKTGLLTPACWSERRARPNARQTLGEAQLLPSRFVRVHRSHLVALERVEKLSRHDSTVAGTAIPVGASYEGAVNLNRDALRAASSTGSGEARDEQ